MHQEIFSKEQQELLSFIQSFKSKFYLVGGTAIALQIGHRKSIDFDLFCRKPFSIATIHKKVVDFNLNHKTLFRSDDQIHYIINGVKITFFYYPFSIPSEVNLGKVISMPDLLSLSAMKAFALGRRAKWKDYVDLYFLLKHHVSITTVSEKAKELFGGEFSSKLFRQQLAYFNDIDYQEEVFYLPGFEVSEEEVKDFLVEIATRPF
jgi:hypothetical protein